MKCAFKETYSTELSIVRSEMARGWVADCIGKIGDVRMVTAMVASYMRNVHFENDLHAFPTPPIPILGSFAFHPPLYPYCTHVDTSRPDSCQRNKTT